MKPKLKIRKGPIAKFDLVVIVMEVSKLANHWNDF